MKKLHLVILFALTAIHSAGQKKFVIEAIGSAYFNSEQHAYENGDQHVYYEMRVGYRINKYFETHAFAGYQLRSFIYYAKYDQPYQLIPLFMDRHYLPIGADVRLYLSDLFFEKLKLWKKQGRWDIYNQIGIAILKGKDENDDRDEYYISHGAYVPYYLVPYVVEYNNVYLTYLAGVRYNFSSSWGVVLEGGEGALMNLQIGLSARF